MSFALSIAIGGSDTSAACYGMEALIPIDELVQIGVFYYITAYNYETQILYASDYETPRKLVGIDVSNFPVAFPTIYTCEAASDRYVPIFVDASGFVWCIDIPESKYIRKFSPDLSEFTTYELKVGNTLLDKISYITPSLGGNYLYLLNSSDRVCAKYNINNLTGDPVWSVQPYSNAQSMFCDKDGNCYILTKTALEKRNESNGSRAWFKSALYHGFFSHKTGNIYVPDNTYQRLSEYTPAGALVGYTTGIAAATWAFCCETDYGENYIYSLSKPYGGGFTYVIWEFPHKDWGSGQAQSNLAYGKVQYYRCAGDPSGHLHYLLLQGYTDPGFEPDEVLPQGTFILYQDNLSIKSESKVSNINLFQDSKYNGNLKISSANFILNLSQTKIGCVTIDKDNDCRYTSKLTNQRVDVAETNFKLTEDGNNLYIRPKTTTKQVKTETENIILNQDVWR